jgi:hypothetical protein
MPACPHHRESGACCSRQPPTALAHWILPSAVAMHTFSHWLILSRAPATTNHVPCRYRHWPTTLRQATTWSRQSKPTVLPSIVGLQSAARLGLSTCQLAEPAHAIDACCGTNPAPHAPVHPFCPRTSASIKGLASCPRTSYRPPFSSPISHASTILCFGRRRSPVPTHLTASLSSCTCLRALSRLGVALGAVTVDPHPPEPHHTIVTPSLVPSLGEPLRRAPHVPLFVLWHGPKVVLVVQVSPELRRTSPLTTVIASP